MKTAHAATKSYPTGRIYGDSTGLLWAEFDPALFHLFDAGDPNFGFGSLIFATKNFENVNFTTLNQ